MKALKKHFEQALLKNNPEEWRLFRQLLFNKNPTKYNNWGIIPGKGSDLLLLGRK